jgi:hypothetical protein
MLILYLKKYCLNHQFTLLHLRQWGNKMELNPENFVDANHASCKLLNLVK